MANYIVHHLLEKIAIVGNVDVNEQNPEELTKQRAQKVLNLLIQHGLPKVNMLHCFPIKEPINSTQQIEKAVSEKVKEELRKANRYVLFIEQ